MKQQQVVAKIQHYQDRLLDAFSLFYISYINDFNLISKETIIKCKNLYKSDSGVVQKKGIL